MLHIGVTSMGEILRDARIEKKLTQNDLALAIGVCKRTIIAIEKNQRNPTFEVLNWLVHELEISADLIFYPDAAPLSIEHDHLNRELSACNKNEQKIVLSTARALIRALQQDRPEKQG